MQQYHGLTAEMYRAVIAVVDERVDAIRVTRQDFNRLNRTVGELARAQRDLAQAQARTEERMGGLETAMQQLAQAQTRTEEWVRRLEEGQVALQRGQAAMQAAIQELAQAQARIEEQMGRLEEGQVALQQGQAAMQAAIHELAQAQARTEVTIGSLAENIGFGLEDIARLLLPPYLHKHYGIHLEGPPGEELQRRFFPLPDQPPLEINLYGEGQRDGRKAIVLGEAKSRIGGGVVKDFADLLAQVEPLVEGEVWRVMFGYYIHPSSQPVGQEHHILLIASYQR